MKKILMVISTVFLLVACSSATGDAADTTQDSSIPPISMSATLMLDWVPNTNHTGIYVAQERGYFAEEGLDLTIIEPGEVFAEQAVASGRVAFGVSFQEQVTLAHAGGDSSLVSIAAILQHNTSGFAALSSTGNNTPADWPGLTYGSFGSPFEAPTLQTLMTCADADFDQVTIVDTGYADPLALLDAEQIGLAWIFYGWQGFQAQGQGIDLDVVMMADHFDCIPDYYTPVLITSREVIDSQPELIRAFLAAVSRGYNDAIENPAEAAQILYDAVPEMDLDLLLASQEWLSPRYAEDVARWGQQSESIWGNYSQWMAEQSIIASPIDANAAFTNEFLP